MSTRCNVAICLREDDRVKIFSCPWNPDLTVNPDGAKYLRIYIHNNGYPDGVGNDLIEMFSDATYEDVLEYILEGDRSTTQTSYHDMRDEHWSQVKPYPMFVPEVEQDYLYCLAERPDGKVEVYIFNEDDNEWELLD